MFVSSPALLLAAGAGVLLLAGAVCWRQVHRMRLRDQMTVAIRARDPQLRLAAVRVATEQGLRAHATMLTALIDRERDPGVLQAVVDGVLRHAWEPTDQQAILQLRLWAHERNAADGHAEVGERAQGRADDSDDLADDWPDHPAADWAEDPAEDRPDETIEQPETDVAGAEEELVLLTHRRPRAEDSPPQVRPIAFAPVRFVRANTLAVGSGLFGATPWVAPLNAGTDPATEHIPLVSPAPAARHRPRHYLCALPQAGATARSGPRHRAYDN